MRERATLRLDAGDELRVEVDRDDPDRSEIVVRRTEEPPPDNGLGLLSAIDAHLADAAPRPAGGLTRPAPAS